MIITEISFLTCGFPFLATVILERTSHELLLSQPQFQIPFHTNLWQSSLPPGSTTTFHFSVLFFLLAAFLGLFYFIISSTTFLHLVCQHHINCIIVIFSSSILPDVCPCYYYFFLSVFSSTPPFAKLSWHAHNIHNFIRFSFN